MLVMALIAVVYAQPQSTSTNEASQTTSSGSTPTSTTNGSPSATLSTSLSISPPTTPTSTESNTPPVPVKTPGPVGDSSPPGSLDCFEAPYCSNNEECYVFNDKLACQEKEFHWGYVLSRNDSGIPSVPAWSGPRFKLGDDCSLFQMPKSDLNPGLALKVYDLIRDTLPKDLLLSRFDQATTNWYTLFSNCEPHLACLKGKCQPRPSLGQSCTSSWQCNAQALGLNENNVPIPSANVSEVRCEYEGGDKSFNTTCQLIKREASGSGKGFVVWHAIVPLVILAIIGYFGWVVYKRYKHEQKHGKWKRVAEDKEDNRNNYPLDAYDDIH
ncbi:hypothetical protein FBU30_002068 [Linnemannia zychae]|nr:hypothetical protein FBU30_002068 [Linnemannia zychae]